MVNVGNWHINNIPEDLKEHPTKSKLVVSLLLCNSWTKVIWNKKNSTKYIKANLVKYEWDKKNHFNNGLLVLLLISHYQQRLLIEVFHWYALQHPQINSYPRLYPWADWTFCIIYYLCNSFYPYRFKLGYTDKYITGFQPHTTFR